MALLNGAGTRGAFLLFLLAVSALVACGPDQQGRDSGVKNASLAKHPTEINTLREQLKQRDDTIASLQTQTKEIKQQVSSASQRQNDLLAKIGVVNDELKRMQNGAADLKSQITSMEQERDSTQQALSTAETALSKLRAEHDRLRKQLAEAKSASKANLKDVKARASTQSKRQAELEIQRSDLAAENNRLKAQLESARNTVKAQQDTIGVMRSQQVDNGDLESPPKQDASEVKAQGQKSEERDEDIPWWYNTEVKP